MWKHKKEKEEEKEEEQQLLTYEERIERLMEAKKNEIKQACSKQINDELDERFKREVADLKTLITWAEPITGEDLLRVVENGGIITRETILRDEIRHNPQLQDIIETMINKNRRYIEVKEAERYRVTIIVEPL